MPDAPTSSTRRSWPYLAAPLHVYLMVMLPICGLQVFLIFLRCPLWMHLSSGVVLLISLYGLIRGYVRRLVITPEGASLRGLFSHINIAWKDVRRVGVYVPGGGVGTTEYFYITTRNHEPAGKWDIGEHTIQIQNREGLELLFHALENGLWS
ncbi:MAG: hypothetical protein HZA51_13820 [Planctomycetes bacterium]|nr:hypothetical protein [Planctomycetota bacterium]